MIKQLLVSFGLILLMVQLHAQEVDAGLKAGVNFVEIDLGDFNPNQAWQRLESDERGVGYHAGAFLRIQFSSLFVQPEIVYTQLNQTPTAEGPAGNARLEVDFNRLDIPMLAGVKAGPLRLQLGPVASFNLNEREEALNSSLRDASFGYQVGASLSIERVSLDVRYEGMLSPIADQISIDGQSFYTDSRANQVILSLMFRIF